MIQMQELDLRFQPVAYGQPRVLSVEQIQFYNDNGYLKPFRIYTQTEADNNRSYFDRLLGEVQSTHGSSNAYAINGYQTLCRGIYDMATHPRILDLVEDLIGPNIVCWGTHFFCKLPHDPKAVPWHQDASYWPLSPARTVTVWLAIDDADVENSCLRVIPGTHRMGHLKWKSTLGAAELDQEITDIDSLGEPLNFELKSGEISIHADMIVHGSEPNRSSRRRCGLTIRYCPPTVIPLEKSWASQSILCRGIDPTGNWSHFPRPDGEDLNPNHRPITIGGN